jgi:hypothetical protein
MSKARRKTIREHLGSKELYGDFLRLRRAGVERLVAFRTVYREKLREGECQTWYETRGKQETPFVICEEGPEKEEALETHCLGMAETTGNATANERG